MARAEMVAVPPNEDELSSIFSAVVLRSQLGRRKAFVRVVTVIPRPRRTDLDRERGGGVRLTAHHSLRSHLAGRLETGGDLPLMMLFKFLSIQKKIRTLDFKMEGFIAKRFQKLVLVVKQEWGYVPASLFFKTKKKMRYGEDEGYFVPGSLSKR